MKNELDEAVRILRAGGLVAFPTETVYGLGADATNAQAVEKIFTAKGRPGTNPLIVHVADATVARRYAAAWPEKAEQLAQAFWPGALTLVLPKSPSIVSQVTAGGSTVGLRSPNHPLAQKLLKKFDGPLAGPSANRSTKISPTTAEHVRRELGNTLDLILDGGPCSVGIESTVLDLTTEIPTILRPGGISREQIEKVIGRVEMFHGVTADDRPAKTAIKSPGQQEVHYSPAAAAYRFEPDEADLICAWCERHPSDAIVVLALNPMSDDLMAALPPQSRVEMPSSASEYARRLYADLHEADSRQVQSIWIEMPPDDAHWHAIRDRIRRATRPAEEA